MLALVAASLSGCLNYADIAFVGFEQSQTYQDVFFGGSIASKKLTWSPDGSAPHPLGPSDPGQGATAMVAQAVSVNAGTTPVAIPVDVFTSDPVPFDLRLNVTQNLGGTMYVQTPVTQVGVQGTAGDTIKFDLELWAGSAFLGGVMRNNSALWPIDGGSYFPYHLHIPLETHLIEKGTILTLKVFHVSHMASVSYGTHAPAASYLRFHVYTDDEWADRSEVPAGFRNNPDEEPPETDPWPDDADADPLAPRKDSRGDLPVGLLGLAIAGGSGLAARRLGPRRTVTILLGLTFLFGALSGCLATKGQETSEDGPPKGTIDSTIGAGYNVPLEKGFGAIAGRVRDDLSLAVGEAHISILKTQNFTDTDADGYFRFLKLEAGTYRLRVDREEFFSLEENVDVQADQVTYVNVTMQPREIKGAGYRPHLHDYWGTATTKLLLEAPVRMVNYDWSLGFATSTMQTGQGFCMNYYVYYNYGCVAEFYLDVENPIIPPGTAYLDATITWDANQNRVPRVGLGFVSNDVTRFGDPYPFNPITYMYPKANGATTHVPVAREMTDVGHQTFSFWHFFVWIPTYSGSNLCACMSWTQLVQSPFHIKLEVRKGVVPVEEAHRDFWGAERTLTLLDDAPLSTGTFYNYPQATVFWDTKDKLVPPGTVRLEAWLDVSDQVATHPWKWEFAYKPANLPAKGVEGLVTASPQGDSTPTKLHYIITLQKGESDAFYQQISNWRFYPSDDVQGGGSTGYSYAGTTTFSLKLLAHRDP